MSHEFAPVPSLPRALRPWLILAAAGLAGGAATTLVWDAGLLALPFAFAWGVGVIAVLVTVVAWLVTWVERRRRADERE